MSANGVLIKTFVVVGLALTLAACGGRETCEIKTMGPRAGQPHLSGGSFSRYQSTSTGGEMRILNRLATTGELEIIDVTYDEKKDRLDQRQETPCGVKKRTIFNPKYIGWHANP